MNDYLVEVVDDIPYFALRPGAIIRVRDPSRMATPFQSGSVAPPAPCLYCGRRRAMNDFTKCLSCGAPPR